MYNYKLQKEKQSKHLPETCSILNSLREHLNPCLGIPVEKIESILKSG